MTIKKTSRLSPQSKWMMSRQMVLAVMLIDPPGRNFLACFDTRLLKFLARQGALAALSPSDRGNVTNEVRSKDMVSSSLTFL